MADPAGGKNVYRPTVKPTGKHTHQTENVTTVKSGNVTGEIKTYVQNNGS